MTLLRIAAALILAVFFSLSIVTPTPATAAHVAAHQCGVQSSSFARTCRPSAYASCMSAVARGVAGFTKAVCDKRAAACSKCLDAVRTCIGRIGHWPKLTHTCDKCKARFDRCYRLRYPKSP